MPEIPSADHIDHEEIEEIAKNSRQAVDKLREKKSIEKKPFLSRAKYWWQHRHGKSGSSGNGNSPTSSPESLKAEAESDFDRFPTAKETFRKIGDKYPGIGLNHECKLVFTGKQYLLKIPPHLPRK